MNINSEPHWYGTGRHYQYLDSLGIPSESWLEELFQ